MFTHADIINFTLSSDLILNFVPKSLAGKARTNWEQRWQVDKWTMGIQGLMKLIGDYAPSAVKDNDIKNYFGKEYFLSV